MMTQSGRAKVNEREQVPPFEWPVRLGAALVSFHCFRSVANCQCAIVNHRNQPKFFHCARDRFYKIMRRASSPLPDPNGGSEMAGKPRRRIRERRIGIKRRGRSHLSLAVGITADKSSAI